MPLYACAPTPLTSLSGKRMHNISRKGKCKLFGLVGVSAFRNDVVVPCNSDFDGFTGLDFKKHL